MKKLLLIIITIIGISSANAQFRFTASVSSITGNCNGLSGSVWIRMQESRCEFYNEKDFSSCEDCNQARDFLLDYNPTNDGCTVRITASPCMPCSGIGVNMGGNGTFGEANVLGLLEGTSAFSSNPANEVQDWAEDNEELLKILGGKQTDRLEFVSDNGYVFSAHMPGEIEKFIKAENNEDPEIYGASDGVHVPDDFFDRPFRLDTWRDNNSGNYKWEKVELQPVHFKEEYKKSINSDLILDDVGDVLKFAASLPLYAEAATLFLADMTINLIIEDTKMAVKLYNGEHVKMDEVTSTIAYNTINKSVEDALFIITSKGLLKTLPTPQLPQSVSSGTTSFISTFVSINSRHIYADE